MNAALSFLDRFRRAERDGDLLAGGEEHVHLAGRRAVADFIGKVDQMVGVVPHGADHHQHLVAGLLWRQHRATTRV